MTSWHSENVLPSCKHALGGVISTIKGIAVGGEKPPSVLAAVILDQAIFTVVKGYRVCRMPSRQFGKTQQMAT